MNNTHPGLTLLQLALTATLLCLLAGCATYSYAGRTFNTQDEALEYMDSAYEHAGKDVRPTNDRVGGSVLIVFPGHDSIAKRLENQGTAFTDYLTETYLKAAHFAVDHVKKRELFDRVTVVEEKDFNLSHVTQNDFIMQHECTMDGSQCYWNIRGRDWSDQALLPFDGKDANNNLKIIIRRWEDLLLKEVRLGIAANPPKIKTPAPSVPVQPTEPTTPHASSGKRLALVIGNSAYKTGALRNPANDAAAMSKALSSVGFQVYTYTNVSQDEMKRAILQFGQQLREQGGTGLFYYAGHGMQVNGKNYLIPTDAVIDGEAFVEVSSVSLDWVLASMSEARNHANIVILDACRNNPYERLRSVSRGLAFTNAPKGTLIAYATAPGSVAADGDGQHGTYTSALLKHMKTPGLAIENVFKRVRIDVNRSTSNTQIPWESSSLTGQFYFVQPLPGASR